MSALGNDESEELSIPPLGLESNVLNGQTKGTDAWCQTDLTSTASGPLPLHYPANLQYAQFMLAISISQSQQVELNIAQLRFYLREHELRSATAAALTGQAAAAILSGQASAVLLNLTSLPNAEAILGAAAAAAGGRVQGGAAGAGARVANGGPGAGGDAAAPQHNPEQQVRLRLRLWAAVKLAIVMLLLEVQSGWFFVYFFLVFLYIGGLFDPLIEWFQRGSRQTTLEQQLNNLRNRARDVPGRGNLDAANADARAAEENSASANTDGLSEEAHSQSQGGANVAAAASQGETAGSSTGQPNGEAASSSSDAGANSASAGGDSPARPGNAAGSDEPEAAPAADEEPARPQPAFAHRFIYQLFIMFFMTLFPWWNPDPRYL